MSSYDLNALATYNAETARGIVHTDEWRAKMAEHQRAFNAEVFGDPVLIPGKMYISPVCRKIPWWRRAFG
jgi:hypothetical protein